MKILFVCHGNICRSPMAEYIFKDLVLCKGLHKSFEITSAATSDEEIGNPVYPPAKRELLRRNIDPKGKYARRITKKDMEYYDLIIAMDFNNLRNLERMFGRSDKVKLLTDYTDGGEIEDPWYSGRYTYVADKIEEGCKALLDELTKEA